MRCDEARCVLPLACRRGRSGDRAPGPALPKVRGRTPAAEPTRLRDQRPRHGRSAPAPPRRYIFSSPLTLSGVGTAFSVGASAQNGDAVPSAAAGSPMRADPTRSPRGLPRSEPEAGRMPARPVPAAHLPPGLYIGRVASQKVPRTRPFRVGHRPSSSRALATGPALDVHTWSGRRPERSPVPATSAP